MKEKIKNIGIVVGHVVCAAVILLCIIYSDKLLKNVATTGTPAPENSVTPTITEIPKQTETPQATFTPTEAITEKPNETIVPTDAATEIPSEIPTPTNTPVPTNTLTPTNTPTPTETPVPTMTEGEQRAQVRKDVLEKINQGYYAEMDNESDGWWFRRKKEHVPSGSGEIFDISEFQGYYRNEQVTEEDKVIYITIDCGYGSENTKVMLETFKKHNVKVTFFVTEFFVKANPHYVRQMLEEGHMVGNHTVSHKNLPELSDQEIYDEIVGCEEAFYEATGQHINLFFRPPEGAYSKRVMQIIEDLGYKTMFWSIAYGDYDKNNQPSVEWILNHFATYHHNGALTLMHNDSNGNRDAMDQVLTYLEEQGYRFGTLDEFGVQEIPENP